MQAIEMRDQGSVKVGMMRSFESLTQHPLPDFFTAGGGTANDLWYEAVIESRSIT